MSALVLAWPPSPQPPSGDSVIRTHVRSMSFGSPAAAATMYELVRAYLERHFRVRQRRIAQILASHTAPRERLLAVVAEVEGFLAGSAFRGCRFIAAAAESRPGEAGAIVAEEYRAWLWSVFTDLAEAVGASDPKQVGRQLFLLYDGAAVAARMDEDRGAAAKAVHSAAMAVLDAAVPSKRKSRRAP